MSDLISNPPPLPGLIFRLCRGEADYSAIVEINNLSWPGDDRLDVDTLDYCRETFGSTPNIDVTHDVLMAEVSGRPVAYAIVTWGLHEDGKHKGQRWFDIEGTVVPVWRRKGIGRALQNWLEARVRAIAQTQPPAIKQTMTSTTRDKNVGRAALLQQFGFVGIDFWFGMEQSLAKATPGYPLPDGLQVRPVRPEHFRQILKARNDAGHDKPDPSIEPTDAELAEFSTWATDQLNQYELWQVAWDVNEVASMVLNNIDVRGNQELGLNRGFTDPICVRHAWRGRGLAKALIARSLNVLRQAGVERAFLGVDTQNPHGALRLYESMGYVKVKSGTTYQKAM